MSNLPADRSNRPPSKAHIATEIDAFVTRMREHAAATRGRLIFALDATASRQPAWDSACLLQSEMFKEAAAIGGLEVQLAYYRGAGECKASRWVSQAGQLTSLMERIDCRGGRTQIGKILAHARREHQAKKVSAQIFVGDSMEEELDDLCHAASELGLLGVPAFMFHEGDDPITEQAFREIARLTRGAYCQFDTGSAQQLGELLRAVAAFAAGGVTALAARKDAGAVKMLTQLKQG
jgi:hypothetical protein